MLPTLISGYKFGIAQGLAQTLEAKAPASEYVEARYDRGDFNSDNESKMTATVYGCT